MIWNREKLFESLDDGIFIDGYLSSSDKSTWFEAISFYNKISNSHSNLDSINSNDISSSDVNLDNNSTADALQDLINMEITYNFFNNSPNEIEEVLFMNALQSQLQKNLSVNSDIQDQIDKAI